MTGTEAPPPAAAFYITIVAVLFTIFFFVSPAEAAVKIYKAKDAGSFSAAPCILAAACSLSQVYYCLAGLLRNHDPKAEWLNFGVNAFGFFMQEVLLVFHYVYNVNARKVFLQNAGMLALLGAFILFLEFVAINWESPSLDFWNPQSPPYLNLCSMVAVVINVGMYAGPLAVMKTVLETKSVEFMPLTPSIFVICASTCWMSEGLLLSNVTFWLPNLLGLLLGLFQVGLWMTFRKKGADSARMVNLLDGAGTARMVSSQEQIETAAGVA